MILNHHEILHYNFINPIKSFLQKKICKKLDTVSVFWENQIPSHVFGGEVRIKRQKCFGKIIIKISIINHFQTITTYIEYVI